MKSDWRVSEIVRRGRGRIVNCEEGEGRGEKERD